MLTHLWAAYVANLILAAAAVLIYTRGVESKPWLGQGIRFGILLALVTAVPQSLVQWVVLPVSYRLAAQWIVGEGLLAVLVGILVAAVCRPQPEPA
jgi:antibiotic biosynthesis monooxygenase (ABM) superfamily enzyme